MLIGRVDCIPIIGEIRDTVSFKINFTIECKVVADHYYDSLSLVSSVFKNLDRNLLNEEIKNISIFIIKVSGGLVNAFLDDKKKF